MSDSPLSPQRATPAELEERLAADRAGEPYLLYRDGHERQRIVTLAEGYDYAIGRNPDSDISLVWDERVSGLHAELRRAGGSWLIVDDGLSRNGTLVNGERVTGRRRMQDGDHIEAGTTLLIFSDPMHGRVKGTVIGERPLFRDEPE
jgi:pSer/pThr/pTyr-binding forkhead associated (FHA) protein